MLRVGSVLSVFQSGRASLSFSLLVPVTGLIGGLIGTVSGTVSIRVPSLAGMGASMGGGDRKP